MKYYSTITKFILIIIFSLICFSNQAKPRVAIIGAGVAGLSAAKYLTDNLQNIEVEVFEATQTIGGRVGHNSGVSLELGPEAIYGPDTEIYRIIDNLGGKLEEVHSFRDNMDTNVYIPYNNTYISLGALKSQNAEAKRFMELVSTIFTSELNDSENSKLPDVSVFDYLFKINNFNQTSYLSLAQSFFTSRYSADLEKLNVKGLNKQIQLNKDYKSYKLVNGFFFNMLKEYYYDQLHPKVMFRLNTRIKEIDYADSNVKIFDKNYESFSFSYVIVTVSTGVLSNENIIFTPSLPQSKLEAISKLKIQPMGRLFLKFNEKFWNDSMKMGVLNIGDIASIHVSTVDPLMLTATIAGSSCEKIQQLHERDPNLVIAQLLNTLQKSFNVTDLKDTLAGFLWYNWTENENVKGGYTYPALQEEKARLELLKPLKNRVYFAGEAVSREPATFHGAIESGIDVAKLLIKYLERHSDL